jgi:hypothetical protein
LDKRRETEGTLGRGPRYLHTTVATEAIVGYGSLGQSVCATTPVCTVTPSVFVCCLLALLRLLVRISSGIATVCVVFFLSAVRQIQEYLCESAAASFQIPAVHRAAARKPGVKPLSTPSAGT